MRVWYRFAAPSAYAFLQQFEGGPKPPPGFDTWFARYEQYLDKTGHAEMQDAEWPMKLAGEGTQQSSCLLP